MSDSASHFIVLQELRKELEKALEDASASAATVVLDQNSIGRLSRMDAMQQQNMAMANQRSLSERLAKTHKAISALTNGDYGYCVDCGESIAEGRLQLFPESNTCLNCQSAEESQK
jgi:DnaK suppressor protein